MEYADVSDGELRLGGSFRSSLTKGPTGKKRMRFLVFSPGVLVMFD